MSNKKIHMEIGFKIKEERVKNKLTQKELADKLNVTSQAVSRWENNEVEPSLSTIKDMAKVFNISFDELLNDNFDALNVSEKTINENSNTEEDSKKVINESSETTDTNENSVEENINGDEPIEDKDKTTSVLIHKNYVGKCEKCGKALFEDDKYTYYPEVEEGDTHIAAYFLCDDCKSGKNNFPTDESSLPNYSYGSTQASTTNGGSLKAGIVVGLIVAAIITSISLYLGFNVFEEPNRIYGFVYGPVLAVLFFFFITDLFMKNNFLGDLWIMIAEFSFVKFPGIIFTFSPSGFAFLIGMKILFFVLGIMIALGVMGLATGLCLVLSPIVFPFALYKYRVDG